MALNRNDTSTDHALPCGRSVEQVWADREAGRAGPHPDCAHCATARRSLDQLAEATQLLVDDPTEPESGLLDRIMAAVRADLSQAEVVALPVPGVDVSTQAVAAVLRFAVDSVDGVRAHRCRVTVEDLDPYAVDVAMTVSLRFGSGEVAALDEVRRRVEASLSSRIGLRMGTLDLEVADVWVEGSP
jgi:uncharacterized alkaline shock family protein YloU